MKHRVGLVREFARYVAVGSAAFLLDWGVLAGGIAVGWHYELATAAGFVAGLLCGFGLCVHYVWRGTRATGLRSFVVFSLVGLGGLAITLFLMWLAAGVVGLRPELAKPFIAGVVLVWDFLLRRQLVFHH